MNEIIVEKIRKLLRLGQSSNAHEAELSMKKALELSMKHGLKLEEIGQKEKETITHDETKAWTRAPVEAVFAVDLVQRFFRVKAIRNTRFTGVHWTFVGFPSDVEVAVYVFNFLVGHFQRSWTRRENKRVRNRQAFLRGMWEGIIVALTYEQMQSDYTGTDLVPVFDDYVADLFGDLKEGKPLNFKETNAKSAENAGYVFGTKTRIHRPLNGWENKGGKLL